MTLTTLKVVDRTLSGEPVHEILLQFSKTKATLKDIISLRVENEVEKYNAKATDYFHGLVRPTEAEETLNGYKMKKRKPIDAETQVYVALRAFQSHGYFVFVDDCQIENLDDEIQITPQTRVSFVKLTPLAGG